MLKIFFRTLRLILAPFMLLWAKLATPEGVKRSTEAQQRVDQECQQLLLYQFNTCPFCIKVCHEISRLSLPITLRDAQHAPEHRAALLQGGGKIQTPCLRITDDRGQIQWLYESADIINYLQGRFASAA